MLWEIINLLPSKDLKAKIKQTNFSFSKRDLAQIVYDYGKTLKEKHRLWKLILDSSEGDEKKCIEAFIKHQNIIYDKFLEAENGHTYELIISGYNYGECINENYSDVTRCFTTIKEFFASYKEKIDYVNICIYKKCVFSDTEPIKNGDYIMKCELNRDAEITSIHYYGNSKFCGDCQLKCNKPYNTTSYSAFFPSVVKEYDVVKYYVETGSLYLGVCASNPSGLVSSYKIVPLVSPMIASQIFELDLGAYLNISAPLVELSSVNELNEKQKESYKIYMNYFKNN